MQPRLMYETRKQITEILRRHGPCSVTEIADHLSGEDDNAITAVTVRYHLRTLQREGTICVPEAIQSGSRGRPQHVYRLVPAVASTRETFRDSLLREVMDALSGAGEGKDSVDGLLARAADRLVSSRVERGSTLEERIGLAIEFLNEGGYQAIAEPAGGVRGWIITTRACPFSTLQGNNSLPFAFCQLDFQLIEALMRQPVQRLTRIAGDDDDCSYFVSAVNDFM